MYNCTVYSRPCTSEFLSRTTVHCTDRRRQTDYLSTEIAHRVEPHEQITLLSTAFRFRWTRFGWSEWLYLVLVPGTWYSLEREREYRYTTNRTIKTIESYLYRYLCCSMLQTRREICVQVGRRRRARVTFFAMKFSLY